MGYTSKNDRRPFESASKASHHHIINDPEVETLLKRLEQTSIVDDVSIEQLIENFKASEDNPVEAIIAVDGGYTEVSLNKEFPSRTIHFLQFGALFFKLDDLAEIDSSAFIDPKDMAKLKNIQRLKLALPTRNLCFKDSDTFKNTVLKAIYEFFLNNNLDEDKSLIDTLAWFIFRQYKQGSRTEQDKIWNLATNPLSPDNNQVRLLETEMDEKYTFTCPETGGKIYLTDIFRLHEIIEEETGAAGILGYLLNVVEHLIIIHLIRLLYNRQPEMLRKVLFIKDGSTGFFGQTAQLHVAMQDLINWLLDKQNILLVGLEKSGAFVDHAQEIQNKLGTGNALILNDDYIYRYILPGTGDPNRPYASTSNYGHKVIFKTGIGQMYVISLPVRELHKNPTSSDLPNLHIILDNVEKLHCDMYDSALFPVALVNKLVSLSAHPSQRILTKFASGTVR